jgi:hypothetical protein
MAAVAALLVSTQLFFSCAKKLPKEYMQELNKARRLFQKPAIPKTPFFRKVLSKSLPQLAEKNSK